MIFDDDLVLCECELDGLKDFVETLEAQHKVEVIQEPGICLTMIRAEDSLEHQEFFLGEALTTECEVSVDGVAGAGLCLGEEPVRGYCLAVIDGIIRKEGSKPQAIAEFIDEQRTVLEKKEALEQELILKTRVDFKLMEQD
jgi:phosphonate C-P lyase system protein PhnG